MGVGPGVGEGVAVGVGVGAGVGFGVGAGVGVGVGEGEGDGVGVGVTVGVGEDFGEGVGLGVGVVEGIGVGDGVGVGIGLMLRVATASIPPARARSVTAPEASALAVVKGPLEGERAAFFASLTDQKTLTRGSSNSTPPACAKARALKSCFEPMSSEAEPGVTSMRESAGEPNGVPSARVPGE